MSVMKQLMIVAIACALGSSPAFADPKAEARKHMQAAAAAYKEGRYEDTLAELEKAYAVDPMPELHYSIGQVYVKLERCPDAIRSYESFLATQPSQERADLANQAIATCKAQLAAQAPPPEPVPPAPEPTPATTETQTDTPPPWWKDPLGLGLTGGGAVVTVVGLVMLSDARGKISDAENAGSYGKSQELYDDAKSKRTTATVITVVGLAATGVGVWRLMQKRRQERDITIVPTADGGVVSYGGSF